VETEGAGNKPAPFLLGGGEAGRALFLGVLFNFISPGRQDNQLPGNLNHLDRIHAAVMSIPAGRVATYGQVAEEAGLPRRARLVGTALKNLSQDSAVPWHRVVNARGEISERPRPDAVTEQRILLEDEGVVFQANGRIDLMVFGWHA
jgi:methylated-DNA-protein-cysteine methyltransferase-like protein